MGYIVPIAYNYLFSKEPKKSARVMPGISGISKQKDLIIPVS